MTYEVGDFLAQSPGNPVWTGGSRAEAISYSRIALDCVLGVLGIQAVCA